MEPVADGDHVIRLHASYSGEARGGLEMRQTIERSRGIRLMTMAVMLAATLCTNEAFAQRSKGGPSYSLRVLSLPTGFVSAIDVSINDRHEIVGTVRVALAGGHPRAAYWAHVDAEPVLLPCLSEPCESRATSINGLGVISGAANGEAVLWHPSGTSWIPEILPNPDRRDETSWAKANHVLDDGTAGGSYLPTVTIIAPSEVPVIWGFLEEVTVLPLPEGFLDGTLARLNVSRDGVGIVRINDGAPPTYLYGALWINDDGGYVTVPFTYFLNDIAPRSTDGSTFLVASDAGRMRVRKDGDSWSYSVEASAGGAGLAINAAGDMVGVIVKGGWLTDGGTPYLLAADGTLNKLPVPSGATGIATDVSGDRWVAGWLYLKRERPAAVWVPTQ